MKKTKRFISILLIIQMMLVCSLIPGVAALDTTETTQIVIETTEELMPMAARGCGSYVTFSTSMANSVAQFHGYSGAEDFKNAYGGGANYSIAYDSRTGEIGILSPNGHFEGTGLYGGW